MINMSEKVLIKELKLQYAKATYTDIGDDLIHPITNGGFSPHLYNRRHIVTNGSFRIDWMAGGSVLGLYNLHTEDDILTDLMVYPFKHQPSDAIKLTALVENSAYYCILPLNENINTINHEQFDLVANQPFTLQRGRLYVSNIDLNVNGTDNAALKPFACVYNPVTLTPTSNGKLVSFYTT